MSKTSIWVYKISFPSNYGPCSQIVAHCSGASQFKLVVECKKCWRYSVMNRISFWPINTKQMETQKHKAFLIASSLSLVNNVRQYSHPKLLPIWIKMEPWDRLSVSQYIDNLEACCWLYRESGTVFPSHFFFEAKVAIENQLGHSFEWYELVDHLHFLERV